MKERFKRTGSWLAVFAMTVFWLMVCHRKDVITDTTSTEAETATQTAITDAAYPLDTDVTLTYWMELNSNVAASYHNMADTPFGKNLIRETGIRIQYIHPADGQELYRAFGTVPFQFHPLFLQVLQAGNRPYPAGVPKKFPEKLNVTAGPIGSAVSCIQKKCLPLAGQALFYILADTAKVTAPERPVPSPALPVR